MHNFKSLLLLSFVSLFLAEGIPDHLKKKLRQAHTVHDIVDHIHLIYHPEKTNSHIQEKKFPTSNRGEFRISSASMMKARPVSRVQAAEQESLDSHTADHLSLFGSIRQGNDTCKLQSVCVPVPVHNDDPQIVIFPKCYEVMQCVGSCCESYEKCHPHSIRKIQKPIIELLYVGNDRFMLNSTLNITMEEHTSCSCYDCGPNAPQCADGLILGPSCTCECANRSERNNCLGTDHIIHTDHEIQDIRDSQITEIEIEPTSTVDHSHITETAPTSNVGDSRVDVTEPTSTVASTEDSGTVSPEPEGSGSIATARSCTPGQIGCGVGFDLDSDDFPPLPTKTYEKPSVGVRRKYNHRRINHGH